MDLVVTSDGRQSWLDWGQGKRRCAVGRGGIAEKRGEGDGITPQGVWPLRQLYYRADRIAAPHCILTPTPIRPDDGWCDAPGDANYNRLVALPYGASHEQMWRFDHIYDLVLVIGYNDEPVVAGKGSAIFLHLARPGFSPTEGCVALGLDDALAALGQLGEGDRIRIGCI
jgi:L,D-peptidoglycan transpeptidase YkuD (ErfK/YbiS/YcfS/YnhG family)